MALQDVLRANAEQFCCYRFALRSFGNLFIMSVCIGKRIVTTGRLFGQLHIASGKLQLFSLIAAGVFVIDYFVLSFFIVFPLLLFRARAIIVA